MTQKLTYCCFEEKKEKYDGLKETLGYSPECWLMNGLKKVKARVYIPNLDIINCIISKPPTVTDSVLADNK